MEKLSTRLNLWSFLVTGTVILNSALGIHALRELRSTDQFLAQVNEVDLRVRRLRESFFQYHNYALIAEITRHASDVKARDESKNLLLKSLKDGLGAQIDSQLSDDFAIEKEDLAPMLKAQPLPGRLPSQSESLFMDKIYRKNFSTAFDQMEQISNRSTQVVHLEEAKNEAFYHRCILLNLTFLACSLALLTLVNLLFRRKVIDPIINVIEVAKKIKNGDLSARVHILGNDEFSEMGKNLNDAIHELQLKREERVKFIGSVVHDIKNPLSAISLTCDLALRKETIGITDATQFKIFGRVKSQVDRIKLMADDLLEAAKNGMPHWSISRSKVQLDDILHEAVDMFPMGSKQNLVFLKENTDVEISGDRNRLIQVITNLISNALKYSPSGSMVELACGRSDKNAFLEVRDQGLGIPEDKKNLIFEPFTRLEEGKNFSTGTGLGLTIVKEIVEAHHGNITVQPGNAGGTVFRIEFPMDRGSL